MRAVFYPIGNLTTSSTLLRSKVLATSVTHSADYDVKHHSGAIDVRIPVLNRDDKVVVLSDFDRPIGMIIELSSKQQSWRFVKEPDCLDSPIEITKPFEVFTYESEKCSWNGECSMASEAIPFEVTAENRGQNLIGEIIVERAVRKPWFWE